MYHILLYQKRLSSLYNKETDHTSFVYTLFFYICFSKQSLLYYQYEFFNVLHNVISLFFYLFSEKILQNNASSLDETILSVWKKLTTTWKHCRERLISLENHLKICNNMTEAFSALYVCETFPMVRQHRLRRGLFWLQEQL